MSAFLSMTLLRETLHRGRVTLGGGFVVFSYHGDGCRIERQLLRVGRIQEEKRTYFKMLVTVREAWDSREQDVAEDRQRIRATERH